MSDIKYVCDSSVAIAFMKQEAKWEEAFDYMQYSCMSVVNYTEVKTKMHDLFNFPQIEFFEALETVDFTKSQAAMAAELYKQTKKYGLSLGDRACIALGMEMKLPIVTTDKAWKDLDLGHKIICIR